MSRAWSATILFSRAFSRKECGEKVRSKAKTCPHCGAAAGKQHIGAGTGCVVILAFIGLLILLGNRAGQPSAPPRVVQKPTSEAASEPPIEYKLAVIDEGSVDPQATVVNRYRHRYLTTKLAQRCSTNPVGIADAAVAARNRLRDAYGRDMKVLALLETADKMPDDLQTYGSDKTATPFALVIQVHK